MAEDKGQASTVAETDETDETEAKAEAEAEAETESIEINSPDDIATLISELEANSSTGVMARSYTVKNGFKAIHPLFGMDPKILALMSGCISYALAHQAAEGVEGASDAQDISLKYGETVGTLTANIALLNNYCQAAIGFGYGPKNADLDTMSQQEKANVVIDFINAQKKKPDNAGFVTWAEALAKSA